MFGKGELNRLRQRKELLVRQCDAHRMALSSEWRRLRSRDFWRAEAGAAARKHPLVTAALGVGAGLAAVQILRRPGLVLRWIGGWSGAGSALFSAWKLFQRFKAPAPIRRQNNS